MGHLIYGGATDYEMDDRTLAHLEAVIVAKLRRHEYCALSWAVDAHAGSGRISLSIHHGVPLQFHYRDSARIRLSPTWLQVLADMANTPSGIVLVTEEEAAELHRKQQEEGAPV